MVPPVGTPSPIDFDDSIPKPVNKTACLITKWSAVWVVHPDKTRSHVSFPTPGCEIKAAPVDKLEAYNKAFNGEGDYFLGTEKSRVACEKLRGCGSPAATQNGAAASTPSSTSVEPALGWGGGVPAGGAWMANSTLRFNAPAAAAFPTLRLEPGEPLLLVFGGASVNDMLKNWVLHVQKLKMPFVVACMDESLFELAAKSNHPAVLMREDASGGESKVSTRWKYYRMDPKAFLSMGILKVRFFMEFMRAGFDVLCSDLDVIWLGDPRPWALGVAKTAELLGLADVVVSTDVTHGNLESDQASWGINNEMNTGMVLLRSTEGAYVFCRRWQARMEQEMLKVAKLDSRMVQWWTNDQTFFNEVVHSGSGLGGANLKDASPIRREVFAQAIRAASPGPSRLAVLEKALRSIESLHKSQDVVALQEMRGVIPKLISCRQHEGKDVCVGTSRGRSSSHDGDVQAAIMGGKRQLVTIATLPYLHFASGHTYFTQSLQDRRGFTPISVHTTFQFGDTPEFTWGKRNRLREKRLWLVDDDSYYQRRGPGTHPSEGKSYSGFLQLSGVLVEGFDQPLMRTESSSSIKIEGSPAYSDMMHRNFGDVHKLDEGNPNKHLLLDSFQRRLVVNAVALGRALKRKVIMPRMTCWCDRYWWLLEGCRFPGVPYDQHSMPFQCPFDHVYDLEKWVHSEVPFREYSFLENPRISPTDLADVVRLKVDGAPPEAKPSSLYESSGNGGGVYTPPGGGRNGTDDRVLSVGIGSSYGKVSEQLASKGWSNAFVVTVDARSLELLCEDLGDPHENGDFNRLTHRVVGVAEQIRFCDRRANVFFDTYDGAKHGPYDPMKNPINCTWGFHRPPLLPEEGRPTCHTSRLVAMEARAKEMKRRWSRQPNTGIYMAYNGAQVWSTNDRVHDLYQEYV